MGTVAGKIGMVVGPLIAFAVAQPLMRLILGSCFFEQGCGGSEGFRLWSFAFALLAVAITAGLGARELVNRLRR